MVEAMRWWEPTRDVQLVHVRTLELIERGRSMQCVWSGKRLTSANLEGNPLVGQRFVREAAATLPTLGAEEAPELEDIHEAVNLKRLRLKHDQRVPEWSI